MTTTSTPSMQNIEKSSHVGYSKTRLLGLFSLFCIDRVDVAVILAAIEKVDTNFSQRVDISQFIDLYVKEWGWVLVLVWERYYELLHDLKEPLVEESKDNEQIEVKDEDDDDEKNTAEADRRKLLLEDRQRPEYFVFLGFLFFIISIKDWEEMSRFVYWLWYASAKSKTPSFETLIDLIPLLWGEKPSHKVLVPKLIAKVRKSSRRLNMDEFDAAKFHILDFSTKGSWTKPIRKMQGEIKWRFATPMVWYRIIENVHFTFKTDIDVALDRLDCPRRKRGTIAYGDKGGERKVVRQYVRKYLKLIKNFLELPRGEELNVKTMNTLLAYAWPLVEYLKGAVRKLGLSRDKPVHPSNNQSEEQKQEITDETKEADARKKKDTNIDDDDIPLEKKYRTALKVNVSVLNDKAAVAREKAMARMEVANDCVYDDFDLDMSMFTKG